MSVAIDEARHDDRVARVYHLRAGGIDVWGNRSDLPALNHHVSLHKVTDLGVHADDGATFDQEAARRIDRGLPLESGWICRGGGVSESPDCCDSRCE
jgi:hypothetical protein